MNTLRKQAIQLRELTKDEAMRAVTWAEKNESDDPLASAYWKLLIALGSMIDVNHSEIAHHWPAPRGTSAQKNAEYLLGGVLNPLYDLRVVLGHAVLAEMAKS